MTDRKTKTGAGLSQESGKHQRIRRFYKEVGVDGEGPFTVLLDGRGLRTPGKRKLELPTRAAAAGIAAEWSEQGDDIDLTTMPLTRLANTATDGVSDHLQAVAHDIRTFAGNDALCYRADGPDSLVELQNNRWNPVLGWANGKLHTVFVTTAGIMPVQQSEQALQNFAKALEPHDPWRLTGLHVVTTLTGSALLALAHEQSFLSADEAWAAAHVDEDFQIAQWGKDQEAAARRAARHAEFRNASQFLSLTRSN